MKFSPKNIAEFLVIIGGLLVLLFLYATYKYWHSVNQLALLSFECPLFIVFCGWVYRVWGPTRYRVYQIIWLTTTLYHLIWFAIVIPKGLNIFSVWFLLVAILAFTALVMEKKGNQNTITQDA